MRGSAEQLVGVWKLISFENEFQDGTPRRAMLGEKPSGYIIFTADGRMMSIIAGEGRRVPQTEEEAAAAFRTMFAYTGVYRLEGDKWTTKVDLAWNPAWDGTEQVRSFELDGDRFQVISAWAMSPNFGKVTRAIVTWERGK
jgi:hypothetical protein